MKLSESTVLSPHLPAAQPLWRPFFASACTCWASLLLAGWLSQSVAPSRPARTWRRDDVHGKEIPEDFLESLQTTRNVDKTSYQHLCNIRVSHLNLGRSTIRTTTSKLRQQNGKIHVFDPFGEASSEKKKQLSLAKRLPFNGCKLTVLKPWASMFKCLQTASMSLYIVPLELMKQDRTSPAARNCWSVPTGSTQPAFHFVLPKLLSEFDWLLELPNIFRPTL
jgi:hypothetical protein